MAAQPSLSRWPESAPERAQPGLAAFAPALLAIAGLICFSHQLRIQWDIWSSDRVDSIGILIPPVSAWLAWRALREGAFELTGNWWGLALIIAAALSAELPIYPFPSVFVAGVGAITIIPIGLMLWAYFSGVVILFGGVRLWRKLCFPLALLLFVDPVPAFVTHYIDLPLQYLGATTARGFAGWLRVPVSGDALQLMFFHQGLGMFVAPGCSGLASAAAMGYAALVAGYLRGLRPLLHGLYVALAVLLAFVFNLIRLCALVLFYCLADLAPILGRHAVGADYLIGAALFALAAVFLLEAPRWAARR